jgi:uncharacterized protein YyaL (SSP411 family)
MYNTKRLAGWILLLMISFTPTLYCAELDWLHDYEQALAQAKQEQKDVYMFIGADKCKFCDRFKEMTLTDKGVLKRLRKEYVLVYLSRDRHLVPEGFQTKGVPRHYFLTPEGKIIHQTWGGREVHGFYDVLDEAELNKMD